MSFSLFDRKFYEASAKTVAPDLLGHYLLRRIGGQWCGGYIVETEAYIENDPACHAYIGGKVLRTPRVKVLWGAPGYAYVYVIYGIYHCFNVACLPKDRAEAVLVRAIAPTHGVEIMRKNRPVKTRKQLTDGPGKLSLAMDIDRSLDGEDLCDLQSPVIIAKNPERDELLEREGGMVVGPRIGLNVAADWPLRFGIRDNKFLSRKF